MLTSLLLLAPALAASPTWFGAGVVVTPELGWGADLKTGDVNADGLPDIVVTSSTGSSWYNGDRPFGLELSLSDGAGGFTSTAVPTALLSGYTMVSDVADLDGDGDADVVVGHADGFSVFFSDGSTLATEADYSGARVGPVELGDVDADGDTDLLTLDDNGDLCLWLNDGAGAFTLAQALPTGAGVVYDFDWDSIDLVDLDGDGALDVIVTIADAVSIGIDPIAAWLGDGTGVFDATVHSTSTTGCTFPQVYDLAVGDVDGDGHVDVVWAGEWSDVCSIPWDGGWGAATSWPIGTYAYNWVLTGDVDGDADTDLVGTVGFDLGVSLQDGGALVDQGTVYPLATTSGWAVADDGIELVDMNADGCADVVATLYAQGTVILPATGPGCTGDTPVAWGGGGSGGETGVADTAVEDTAVEDTAVEVGDTAVEPPSFMVCSVTSPRAGSLGALALLALGLIRRR